MQEIITIIGKKYPDIVIPEIDQAKTSIDIVVFDWRWYDKDFCNPVQLFNQAIARAVRRGVKVSAVVNFGYSIQFLLDIGVDVREYKHKGTLHSKIVIIDNKHVILGSHNFSQSAFTSNVETSILLKNFKDVDMLKNLIDNIKN